MLWFAWADWGASTAGSRGASSGPEGVVSIYQASMICRASASVPVQAGKPRFWGSVVSYAHAPLGIRITYDEQGHLRRSKTPDEAGL